MPLETGELVHKNFKKRNLLKYLLGAGSVAGGIGLFSKQKAQAVTNSWVYMHGTSVQVELPNLTTNILRQGFYTTIEGQPNTFNWFHFAIPTLIISSTVKLTGGIVFLNTGSSNVAVKNIHLYSYSQKVAAKDNLNLYGNTVAYVPYSQPSSASLSAVGISVGVSFGGGTPRYIQFIQAAGIFDNIV